MIVYHRLRVVLCVMERYEHLVNLGGKVMNTIIETIGKEGMKENAFLTNF